MQNSNTSPTEGERIDREAADWVAQIDRGLSAAEEEAFSEWLGANPRHGEVFSEDQEQWQSFDSLDQFLPKNGGDVDLDLFKKADAIPFWKNRFNWYGTAAVLALSLLGVAVLKVNFSDGVYTLANGDYATAYERHVLSDGSIVELNEGAQVAVLFLADERRVELRSGEAHFSVSKNPQRPFAVAAGETIVRAVGTAFSVKFSSDSLEVLVTEGTVRMEPVTGSVAIDGIASSVDVPALEPALLVAGQRAVQSFEQAIFEPEVFAVTPNEIETLLDWKDGILDFNLRPLSEVVAAFNAHNDIKIVIAEDELQDLEVSIALKPSNYKGFLRLLEISAGIAAEEIGEDRIELRRE